MIEQEKKVIQGAISEMIDSMTRQAAEKDLQKEIVSKIKEETTVSPKIFRKLAKVAFAANFAEEVAVHSEFEEIYQEILNG